MTELQQVPLEKIIPNPLNTRTNYSGKKFNELVDSIRKNGVLQPVLVREKDNKFELIAGERRYRACMKINDGSTIPAMVKKISDNQAFDMMMVENIMREDLSEFEEAQGFHNYLKGKDDTALEDLAQRTGLSPGYIRRRTAVMKLPKKYLAAWKKGQLAYGHLEILIRVEDATERANLFKRAVEYRWSVKNIRDEFNRRAPLLKNALFDKKAAGCPTCFNNSAKQKQLFDLDDDDRACCLKPECFVKHTREHLDKNWEKTSWAKKCKTNVYRFDHEVSWQDYEYMNRPVSKDCLACDKYATVLYVATGKSAHDRVCLDPACYKAKRRAAENKTATGKPIKTDPNAPRVAWHGEYFREKFYETAIPEKFETIKPEDPITGRMAVMCLLKANPDLKQWYCERLGIKKNFDHGYVSLPDNEKFAPLEKLNSAELNKLIKEMSVEIIKLKDFSSEGRRIVADHIGIDLKKQWQPDKEYLSKKIKTELIDIGKKFKIFKQKKVDHYINNKFPNRNGDLNKFKKSELIDVFMKSGADLSGVVPDEILK
jgi:ParB family chromosome partitioning protein